MTSLKETYYELRSYLRLLSPVEYACLYGSILLIFIYQFSIPLFDTPDSIGYRQFAHYLYLRFHGLSIPPPDSFYYRTPVYPLFLLITDYSPFSFSVDLRGLYLLLTTITLGKLLKTFRHQCHPLVTSASFLCCCYQMRPFYFTALTEWLCFCLLFLFLAEALLFCRDQNGWQLFSLVLLASILCLSRPALLFCMIIPPILAYWYRFAFWRSIVALIAGMVPVIAWTGMNCVRYNQCSLAPFEGISLFGMASLIDGASVRKGDPPALRYFIQEVNKKKACCSDILERSSEDIDAIERNFTSNVWELSYTIRTKAHWSIPEWNLLSKHYALRVIGEAPWTYGALAITVFFSQLRFLQLVDLAILLLGVLCYLKLAKPQKDSMARLLILSVLIHLIHSALISLSNPYIIRLFLLGTTPLVFSLWMTIGAYFVSPEDWELLPDDESHQESLR